MGNEVIFSKEVCKKPVDWLIENIDLNRVIGIDIETKAKEKHKKFKDAPLYRHMADINSVQLNYRDKDGVEWSEFYDFTHFSLTEWETLLKFFKKGKLITHNGKFDFLFLFDKVGVLLEPFADTQLMAHVLCYEEFNLKYLIKTKFGDDYDISNEAKSGDITPELIEYGIKDVYYLPRLWKMLRQEIIDNDLVDVYKHELRAYKAYIQIEKEGIYISEDKDKAREFLHSKYEPLAEKLNEVAKIKWSSADQVGKVLFSSIDTEILGDVKKETWVEVTLPAMDIHYGKGRSIKTVKEATELIRLLSKELKVPMTKFQKIRQVEKTQETLGWGLGLTPVEFTDKGKPSVGKSALAKMWNDHEVIPILKEWRDWTKLETFIDSWETIADDNGMIHPSFSILARTGRTTCSNPNLKIVGSFTVMCQNKQRELMEALLLKWVIMSQDY